jgi:hypothetical protein
MASKDESEREADLIRQGLGPYLNRRADDPFPGKSNRPARRKLGTSERDAVKIMIHQAVQHHLVTTSARPELPAMPATVESVEGIPVDHKNTLIRVRTTEGVRSFTVTVRENMQ